MTNTTTETKTLRQHRRERLYTVRALCAEAGVSTRTLSRVEAGTTVPALSTIRALSRALGVEPGTVTEFARSIDGGDR